MFFILPFLPLPAPESLPLLAGSCCVHLAYYICMSAAYRNVDMSYAYTIMRGTAPLMTSLALLLAGSELSMGRLGRHSVPLRRGFDIDPGQYPTGTFQPARHPRRVRYSRRHYGLYTVRRLWSQG